MAHSSTKLLHSNPLPVQIRKYNKITGSIPSIIFFQIMLGQHFKSAFLVMMLNNTYYTCIILKPTFKLNKTGQKAVEL